MTSEKLNKLEEGVANAGPIVLNILHEDPTPTPKSAEKSGAKGAEYNTWLDRTWQEIFDLLVQGKTIVFPFTDGETLAIYGNVVRASVNQGSYNVTATLVQDDITFYATANTAYPGGNL